MIDLLLLDTEERIKAFTHPYRMKLIHVFRETRLPMTATEVARMLGEGPGKVHYHMRVLEAAGLVTVVRTESVNGIVARYYEPTARHYSVSDAARGSVGGEPIRDEVARMISRRFRDGLRTFLDRTVSMSEPAGGDASIRGDDAFLFKHVVHCNDDQWLSFRESVEELAARYAEPAAGTRPRRFFVAGATDRPGSTYGGLPRDGRPAPDESVQQAWKAHQQPER
jgi:DNA-binding transcriptional ArsR family regulator